MIIRDSELKLIVGLLKEHIEKSQDLGLEKLVGKLKGMMKDDRVV